MSASGILRTSVAGLSMSVAGGKAEVPELGHDFRFWTHNGRRSDHANNWNRRLRDTHKYCCVPVWVWR
jgi:hypothetical protein